MNANENSQRRRLENKCMRVVQLKPFRGAASDYDRSQAMT